MEYNSILKCVCLCLCVCVRACVCVCERERELTLMRLRNSKYAPQLSELHKQTKCRLFMHLLLFDGEKMQTKPKTKQVDLNACMQANWSFDGEKTSKQHEKEL